MPVNEMVMPHVHARQGVAPDDHSMDILQAVFLHRQVILGLCFKSRRVMKYK